MVESGCLFKNVNGYEAIIIDDKDYYDDFIEFSPFNGTLLKNGFLWELQHKIYDELAQAEKDVALQDMLLSKKLLTCFFNNSDVPTEYKCFLDSKEWFYEDIKKFQESHKNKSLCGALSAFIDGLYGLDDLPLIAKVPIQYCPWCGAELDERFHQDDWFEKNKVNW